jgi:hypothetical protein
MPGTNGSMAVITDASKIYLIGGWNSSGRRNTIWTASITTPGIVGDSGVTFPVTMSDGKILEISGTAYMYGGIINGTGPVYNDKIYTASTSNLTLWGDSGFTIPKAISGQTVHVIGNKIWIYWGQDINGYNSASYTASTSNPLTVGFAGTTNHSMINSTVFNIRDVLYGYGGTTRGDANFTASQRILTASSANPLLWGTGSTNTGLPGASNGAFFAIGNTHFMAGGYVGSTTVTNRIYAITANNPLTVIGTSFTIPTASHYQVGVALTSSAAGTAYVAIYGGGVGNSSDTTNATWTGSVNRVIVNQSSSFDYSSYLRWRTLISLTPESTAPNQSTVLYATSASWASSSISASVATTASFAASSSYPWFITSSAPYHNIRPVTIGFVGAASSQLSVVDNTSGSVSQSVMDITSYRTDTTPVALDIRNSTSSSNANSRVGVLFSLGPTGSLEGGTIFATRTATPSFGLVNGLNLRPNNSTGDVGISTGIALSGSVAGPTLQIKAAGTIGIGVASPTNARLHIGGTELAFYNATIRLTNGSAGGADVYMAATDDAWGGSVTGKFLIGTGDPSSGTPIIQLYPPAASVGIGIVNTLTPQAKLHVQGNISASSATASLFGTASWAFNALTASVAGTTTSASYAGTASVLIGSVQSATFALSASWASQSLSASYVSASNVDGRVPTASYALNALSASYAPGTPSISASYALTASFALNAGGTAVSSRAMVLCAGFTPFLSGSDYAEIPVPYSADGITPLSWSVNRLNLRVQLSASTTTASIVIEKSSAVGAFVADATLGRLTLNSQSYQTFTGSLQPIVSGDKLRFGVVDIGLAQYWTITTEISSCQWFRS